MTKTENNPVKPIDEILETRKRNLDRFTEWILASGLSPLDYELVEERRGDGTTLWYYRKRKKT